MGKYISWDSMNLKHFPVAYTAMLLQCRVVCALMPSLVCLSIYPVTQQQISAPLCSHP